jgi:two-component system response regulator FixJ
LTGHGDVPMAVEAMRLGAVDFLEKPYPPKELLEAIARACQMKTTSGEGGQIVNQLAVQKVAALSDRERLVLQGVLKGHPTRSSLGRQG